MRRKSESFARRLSNFKICWPVKSSLERCATRWEKQAAVMQVAENNWLLRCGPKEPLRHTQTAKKRLTWRRYLRTWCQDVVSWGHNPDFGFWGHNPDFDFSVWYRSGREGEKCWPPDHMWKMSYPSDYNEMRLLKFFLCMGKLILLDFESLWIIISMLPLCLYFTVPEVAGENPGRTNNKLP